MQRVISQFELNFWNWYIVLLSQSPLLQKIVPVFYRLSRKQMVQFYFSAIAVSAAGFITGTLLYSWIGR